MSDPDTLAYYSASVDRYRDLVAADFHAADRDRFLDGLPAAARLLDLGCGPGFDAARMARAGHVVEAWDAVPEMAAAADAAPGVTGRCARFDDLQARGVYDGIWAAFSLLHAPRTALPDHLTAIHRALRPGGRAYVAMKLGHGESRDRLGRLYTYVTEEELLGMLSDAGLTVTATRTGTAKGMAGRDDPFLSVFADA
ncbi:class I SAM-dependent methyltransferase [Mesobaculum littorinae]|uniref:Class I SAM-dependent methyltransferase n=1 Tax=Mesobaculum littorinae TaxID=2486419 RepID=A0A438AFN9_9RHOB|nr:class I SAM-dependent methyltransferase [Mesobaculum littorinae]RVV97492.1 class I SAM-dependent methyltransferase [Mesobaculum littorinae]